MSDEDGLDPDDARITLVDGAGTTIERLFSFFVYEGTGHAREVASVTWDGDRGNPFVTITLCDASTDDSTPTPPKPVEEIEV